jgi:hypothetical protein
VTTHYDVLGVSPKASAEQIKRAYYRRARAYHPDAHVGSSAAIVDEAQQAMAALNAAWTVLQDDGSRARYDSSLEADTPGRGRTKRGAPVRPALGAGFHPWLGSTGITAIGATRTFNLQVDGTGDLSPLRALAPDGLFGLHAAEAPVDDRQLRHLAGLRGLRLLDLSGTRVTGPGLVHLQALDGLESLHLWDTAVNDEALPLIGRLVSLRHLGLGNTRVTDSGIVHLSRLSNLRVLQLWGTEVTGEGLAHLHQLRGLEMLTLPWRVRGRHRRRLKRALPATQVA